MFEWLRFMSRSSAAIQTNFHAFPMSTGYLLSARMMVRPKPSMLWNCWHISKFGIRFLRSLYQSSCVFFAATTNVITHISQAAMPLFRICWGLLEMPWPSTLFLPTQGSFSAWRCYQIHPFGVQSWTTGPLFTCQILQENWNGIC